MGKGLTDVFEGFKQWQLWMSLAWEEFRARYHKTFIGPIWLTLSFLAFIAVKVFIFGAMNTGDGDYFVSYLTVGFMAWTYVSNAINNGCSALVISRGWILGIKSPYSVFIYKSLFESFISLFFVSISAVAIAYLYTPFTALDFLMSMLGVVCVIFSLFWVQLLLSILCVFVRDLIQLIGTGMRIAFFLTPIIWVPETIGIRSEFVYWNPFTHILALIRDPLIGNGIPTGSYMVVAGITLVTIVASISLLSTSKRFIALHV